MWVPQVGGHKGRPYGKQVCGRTKRTGRPVLFFSRTNPSAGSGRIISAMADMRAVGVFLLGAVFSVPVLGETPQVIGVVRVSAGSFDTAPSFQEGGFGKLLGGSEDGRVESVIGEARLAMDWQMGAGWDLFVHGVARRDADGEGTSGGAGSGLLEAFVEKSFGDGEWHLWTVRAGQFFLPSSRENVDSLWTSPYTLSLSAMNSWIAEEIRPIGVDVAYRKTFPSDHKIQLAATVFGGNDTSATLLAWRGFSFHDRPTPTGRFVPLPPIERFDEPFPRQSTRGSKAFGSDLDGRPGYAGRARWSAPDDRAIIQVTAFLNRGDRALHGEEYAWETDFRWLSVETRLPADFRLIGEWGTGTSLMGFAPPGGKSDAVVDIGFDTFYVLLTRDFGTWRATVRYDDFRIEDRDSTALDDNREDGRAWTLAVLVPIDEHWRAGVEWLDVAAARPAARQAGSRPVDGDSLRAELRFAF